GKVVDECNQRRRRAWHSPHRKVECSGLKSRGLALIPVLSAQPAPLEDACGDDPSFVCRRVFDWTGSEAWAEAAEKLLATPATILLILVIAFVVNRLVRRAIRRLVDRITDPGSTERLRAIRR